MNIKEKQVILYYLKNILQSNMEPDDMADFCHDIARIAEDMFGFDLNRYFAHMPDSMAGKEKLPFVKNLINGNITQGSVIHNSDKVERYQKILDESIANLNVDITKPEFDMSLNYVFKAFDLNESCSSVLRLFVYNSKLSNLRKILNNFRDQFSRTIMTLECSELIGAACKVDVNEVKQILAHNGVLKEIGILNYSYSDIEFSNMFSKLINTKFESMTDVRNTLVGSPLVATLSEIDFDYMAQDFQNIHKILSNAVKNKVSGVNILLYGHPGCGKTEIAKTICDKANVRLYATKDDKEDKGGRLSNLAQMQAILKEDDTAIILFDEAEDVFTFDPFATNTPSKLYLNRRLETNNRPVIWITNNIKAMDSAYVRRFSLPVEVIDPDETAKINAWKRISQKYELDIDDKKLQKLVKKYNVPLAFVDTAMKNVNLSGDMNMLEYTMDNIVQAITGVAPSDKVSEDVPFDTSLLNTDVNLQNLANKIKNKNNKTFSLCLYGAPGTGKTAFVDYLADLLKMPVVKKRASDIIGSYVGETEKNIAGAFNEAKNKKAILVFDEADSFLKDRNTAMRSWEVTCVNEMLTQMESAKFPFVCTTNLMQSMDKASLRRFSFKVKYDYLTQDQIVLAFKAFFGQDIDAKDIAELDKLTPGDFKVVKNQAKFLETEDVKELIKMLKQEQQSKKTTNNGKIGF